jgi:thioesterase domain-containing protein
MYGPTETTIWSSVSRIEKDQPVLIGQPIANTTFYILNGCSWSDPTLGWRDVALGGVDVIWVPGDHESMFVEPNVSSFGKLLEEVLERDSNGNDPVFSSSPGASDELLQISK